MSRLTLRQAPGRAPVRLNAQHPKAALVSESGVRVELPFAPREGNHDGWSERYTRQDRPGRRQLALPDGPGLDTYNATVTLADRRDGDRDVEGLILALKRLAAGKERVTIVGMSPREAGPWRIESMPVAVLARQQGSNRITHATANMTFVAASDPNPKVGPVSGGSGGKGPKERPKFYVVKKGDTLRKIAAKFYDDPAVWKLIAKKNKISDPEKVKVGRRLELPDVLAHETDDNPLNGRR